MEGPFFHPKRKKRIIRILIEDVTITADKGCSTFTAGIRFRSGKCEQLALQKPLPVYARRKHTEETIQRIRELAICMDDAEIAEHFNVSGITTPEGKPFTSSGIRWLRHKYQIPGLFLAKKDGLSVTETAALLGISIHQVYYGINAGKLPARKQKQGWPWEILIDQSNLEEIKKQYSR